MSRRVEALGDGQPTGSAELQARCECDDKHCEDGCHGGQPCKNAAWDHGPVQTSPALCMPCLYGCAP